MVMFPVRVALAGLAGYALGTLPSADIAARLNGVDLRAEGTGNPGAMNASHVLGTSWGVAVTVGDGGKGVAAARVGAALAGSAGANAAASAAVAGHCFPPGRTGGKGVATSIGQVLGTFPAYLPVDVTVGYLTTKLPVGRHRTRAATSVASAMWIGAATVAWRRGWRGPGGSPASVALPLGALASTVVIAARFAAEAEKVEAYNLTLVGEEDAA
ncbi:MAG: glycerol-3-phosphate acyltransferase [Acidimicrobiales bacterium]|nr:glycerol-3-phosphate acyltransferase [Acidimicrobiales bacterium]